MIHRDGNTIYELNAQGVNRWYAGVQAGHDDFGNRTAWTELEKIAVKLRAVDELYEALDKLKASYELLAYDYEDAIGAGDIHPIHAEYIQRSADALAKARGEA